MVINRRVPECYNQDLQIVGATDILWDLFEVEEIPEKKDLVIIDCSFGLRFLIWKAREEEQRRQIWKR